MLSIRQWLESLGLAQYAAAFEEEDVGSDILSALTEEDLQRLGVSLGHRKRILRALQQADPQSSTPQPPSINVSAAEIPDSIESLTSQGERRQVTVLFCDLVGSTALSNTHDPEEYRSILARYHETGIGAIQRFDGFVAQIQGDGIVAYFGYPLAHEGESERAVRAGLEIIEALAALDMGLEQPLRVRIGVASGLVVVSHVLAPDKSAVGETPNLAARLQTVAHPGEIMVSERTRMLAGGGFEYEDRGVHALKGIAEPTRAWKVTGPSTATSRFDAATRGGLTPMVGREHEVALMLDRWELSSAGEGQVMLLQGEPGIGKSRMLRAFQVTLGCRAETSLLFQCSPYYTNSAFYPFINHLERALQFRKDDSYDQKLDKIEARLINEMKLSNTECILLAHTLSVPCEARYGTFDMSSQRQKEETIALLVDFIEAVAQSSSTVVLFEDAHWADPTSIEVLGALVDRTRGLPLLVVITYRPEFHPPWLSRSHVTALSLARLSRTQGANIVLRVAGDSPLPAELVTQIVDKTDGVPLFLEELTKSVIESDMLVDRGDHYDYSGAVDKLAIPNTLRDSLMSRLDRLIPVKEIAQIGACLGREFSHEMLVAVSPMVGAQLDDALEKLAASELIFRLGSPPEAVYVFKHALVQDAAYDSLLKTKRHELHAKIAEVICEHFPSKTETEPELVAHHFTEAGLPETAIPYWEKAGELAQKRVALQEAIRHFDTGLQLTRQMPPSRERDERERQLRTLLSMAWVGLHGYTHPQIALNLEPALQLDELLGGGDYTLQILWGLWVYRLCKGEIETSLEWARRLLTTAEERDSEDLRLAGHWTACNSYYFMGEFENSIHHANSILEIYDAERHGHIADLISHDPKTIALAYRSGAEWILGFPDRALATAKEGVSNADRRKHAFDVCWVRSFTGHEVLNYLADVTALEDFLEHTERIALDQRLIFFLDAYCPLLRALCLLHAGDATDADVQFNKALSQWLGAGMGVAAPTFKALHAECKARCGDIDSAFKLLDEALDQISKPEWQERYNLSNVLRIKASLLHQQRRSSEADVLYRKALDVAREQKAKSWELRAATGYARLLRDVGKDDEAITLLEPIHNWFTEGFETPDMRAAKALLHDLTRSPAAATNASASAAGS
jgi:class 3 adenylate cyclase/tetratricopeptide (TPR) repeat protein